MNEPEPEHDQQERIRALLADLGSGPDGGRLPAEVAARLDETLSGLVAEREAGAVVPLRRRRMPRLAAAAAAAVVVLGLGGLAAANLGAFGGRTDTPRSSEAGAGTAQEKTPERTPVQAPAQAPPLSAAAGVVRSAHFAEDARTVLRDNPVLRPPGRKFALRDQAPRPQSLTPSCPGPAPRDGARSALISYDGGAAVLVVHPPKGGASLVEAWSCDGTRRLASTSLAP